MDHIHSRLMRSGCWILLVGVSVLTGGCDANLPETASSDSGVAFDKSDRAETHSAPSADAKSVSEPLLPVTPAFVEVAHQSGIDFQFFSDTVPDRYFLPEVMGGGAAWTDVDRDSIPDLYLMNGSRLDPATNSKTQHVNHLYRGHPTGGFRHVGDDNGTADEGYGQGCAAGDYNSDGFPDLYLGNFRSNVLLLNNGDGTFTDVSQATGSHDPQWTSSVIWHDIDGDLDLDLYVTNYLDVTLENIKECKYGEHQGYCGPGQYEALPDQVFLNQSDGSFVEAAGELGLTGETGKGLAIVAADFDGDRVSEIYVANDMAPNFLFTQSQDATDKVRYENVAATAGCAQSGEGMNEASMGIACADFDGDTRYDLYLTHYHQMKNTLYRNLGGLNFDDASLRLGAAGTSYKYLGFGTAPLDFDRDGWQDLFITNGHVLGPLNPPYRMAGQVLHNREGRQFKDISQHAGPYFQKEWLGRGVAAGDFDSDGDIDIAVTHIDQTAALLRNDTPVGGHFLGIDLRTESRVPPIGARVRIEGATVSQQLALVTGGSYLCTHDHRLLFGWLGADDTVDVTIEWPSGTTDRIERLEVDRYWALKEGDSPR